jgi:O-antigen ligase
MTALAYGALWIFAFSIPWERVLVLPGISIITQVTGGLAFALALFAVVISGRFRRWHLFHVVALLFWIWAAIDLFFNETGQKLPNKLWTFGQLLLVVWIIWELATTERRLLGLLTAYVLGAYVSVFDTVLIFRRQAGALRRFAAGGADPNDLAMILALGIPMAWYLGLRYRQPLLRWVCRGYLPAALLAVGLTGSRGGMLATTVALAIIPVCMTRLTPGRMATAFAMLAISGALAVAYTPETLIERLATTGTELEGGRLGGRGKLWVAGFQAFAQRPLVGYGTGRFREAITPMLGESAQVAHNSFISLLVEQGIIGFVLYLIMLVTVFRSVLRLPRLERRFAIVLFATMGAAMMPLTWEDRKAVWLVMPTLLGLSRVYLARRAATAAVPAPAPLPQPAPRGAGRGPEWAATRVRPAPGEME